LLVSPFRARFGHRSKGSKSHALHLQSGEANALTSLARTGWRQGSGTVPDRA